jgi:hypothetical protein
MSVDAPSQPEPLPDWLRIALAALAAVQAAFAVAALGFAPPGRADLFDLPIGLVRAGAALSALALIALALAAWIAPRSRILHRAFGALRALRRHPLSLILPLALLIPPALYLPARWIGYPLLSVQCLLLALILILSGPEVTSPRAGWWMAAASIAVFVIGLALRLWFVTHAALDDEGMTLSAAAHMAHGGGLAPGMMRLPAEAPDRPDWGHALVLYGWWARIFGAGLLQIRVFGLLVGLLALGTLYAAVRRLYDAPAALAGSSLAALSVLGLLSATGRNTALPMLATGLVLLAHVAACKGDRRWPHLLVGVLAGLALEVHLLALSLIVALGGAYLLAYLRAVRADGRWLRSDPLWYYIAGALPVLVLYILIHIVSLPHTAAYLDYLSRFGGGSLRARIAASTLRYKLLWDQSPAEFLLILVAAAAAIVRRDPPDRRWLALLTFNEVGYLIFNPTNVVNNAYTAFALPILFAGVGPLITRGFRRADAPGPAWSRVAYAAAALTLGIYAVHMIRDADHTYRAFDAVRRPLAEAVAERVPPGETVLALEFYYPYLDGYDVLLTPGDHHDSTLAPALAGRDHDAYWLDVLLETWPRARIESHFFPPLADPDPSTLPGSYFAALEADHVRDYLWIAPVDSFVRPGIDASPGGPLEFVAYRALPADPTPGSEVTLYTVWVSRSTIGADLRASLALVGGGEPIPLSDLPLVDTNTGEATASWDAYRFHGVPLTFRIPADIPAGDYTLRATLTPTPACDPACTVDLMDLSIRP